MQSILLSGESGHATQKIKFSIITGDDYSLGLPIAIAAKLEKLLFV